MTEKKEFRGVRISMDGQDGPLRVKVECPKCTKPFDVALPASVTSQKVTCPHCHSEHTVTPTK